MPQSLCVAHLHLVFATKHRHPWLRDPQLRNRVHAYLATASSELGHLALAVGGVEDHVHLLVGFGRTGEIADWVRDLKRASTGMVRGAGQQGAGFSWQSGYGVFAVHVDGVPAVRRYVQDQVNHHAKVSFQDEYRQLLRDHHAEWDERYVWD